MLVSTRPHQKLVFGLIGSASMSCAVYDGSLLDLPSSGRAAGSSSSDVMTSTPPFSASPLAGKGGGTAGGTEHEANGGTAPVPRSAAGGNPAVAGSAGETLGGSSGGAAMSLAGASAGGSGQADPLCNATAAKEGKPCTQECIVPCGFRELGTKTCTCSGGVYSQCSCPRPASYQGAPTAGYCTTPDGSTLAIDETACSAEWDQCIGTDPVSGVTPRGCACITDPELGIPAWVCQSTNGWFILAP